MSLLLQKGGEECVRGVNKAILIGNATRDAELRQTKSGKAVANVRLATNRKVGGNEVTQYHTIICWDRLAETVGQYVKKGEPVYVEGRLEYRSFQDEEGKERGVAEIIADDVQFLGRKASAQDGPAADAPATADEDELLADIPF
jgi:single-strand DNA-binding protein